MENTGNAVNKNKIFAEIISGYQKEIDNGYDKTIDSYLGSLVEQYNKKYEESYPRSVKPEDREVLLVYTHSDKSKAAFFDAVLQVDVESIKRAEIASLELSELERKFVELSLDYTYIENHRAAGKVVVNPMNIFGALVFKNFAQEKIDPKLLKDSRYSQKEILDYYYNESEGYRKIISSLAHEFLLLLLEEKGIQENEVSIEIANKPNNEYLFMVKKKGTEDGFWIRCVFEGGYYQFWNDNDDRFVNEFNLDLIVPDYRESLV